MIRFSPALLLATAIAAQGAPSVSLSVSADAVYLHEPFQFVLRVQDLESNAEPVARFDTSSAADIAGPSISSEDRTFIQNGKVTRFNARTLTYRVVPQSPGPLTFSNASVTVDGRTYAARGTATVSVIGPEPSPYLTLALSASRDRVLVDEPFEVYLDVTIQKLPSPFENESPVSLQATPALLVPYLEEPPSDALRGQDPAALLNSLLAPRGTPGFSINGHTVSSDPFGGAFPDPFGGGLSPFPSLHSSTAVFAPPREDALLGGKPAWNYRIAARFTAEREGDVTFPPAAFRGLLITGVRAGNQAETSRLFCESQPLTVHVVPPPAEGRPGTYAGAVGTSLAATASLDAQSCRQGDPVRLTLDVTGSFSRRTFALPPLADRPGFRDVFRVYEGDDDRKVEPIPGGFRHTWTLRPLQAGTLEVPPIEIAYYNTLSNAYATVRTSPIPLRVDEVPSFDPASVFAELEAAESSLSSARSDALLPAAITVGSAALAPAPPPSVPVLAAFLAAPPLFAAAVFLARRRRRTRAARRLAARRRRAPRRAARALRRARTPQAALRAAAAYFHDAFDIPPAAFTPADAELALRAANCPEDRITALRTLLQPLYDATFADAPSPSAGDTATIAAELAKLLADFTNTAPAREKNA